MFIFTVLFFVFVVVNLLENTLIKLLKDMWEELFGKHECHQKEDAIAKDFYDEIDTKNLISEYKKC
jgi:hypothetical protein